MLRLVLGLLYSALMPMRRMRGATCLRPTSKPRALSMWRGMRLPANG